MVALPKGPYTIKIDYTVPISSVSFVHTLEVNVSPIGAPAVGVLASAVSLGTRAGGSATFAVAANDIWNLFRQAYNNSITATTATLYRSDGPPDGDVFISAVALTNPTGSGAAAPNPGHQETLTLRSGNGNVMKVVYLESQSASKVRVALTANAVGTPYQRMAAYLMSGSSVVHGRGAAFPVALMNQSGGGNEAVERARFRPNT